MNFMAYRLLATAHLVQCSDGMFSQILEVSIFTISTKNLARASYKLYTFTSDQTWRHTTDRDSELLGSGIAIVHLTA